MGLESFGAESNSPSKQTAEQKKQYNYEVLPSHEIVDKLCLDIANAKRFVFVNMHVWRDDRDGNRVMDACMKAAERGVQVFVIKDYAGAFFEWSEREGRSMFHHDMPIHKRVFSKHGASSIGHRLVSLVGEGFSSAKFKHKPREDFLDNPNIHIVDDLEINDHSKVVVVDDVSYVMGSNFENQQELNRDKNIENILDFGIRIEGRTEARNLLSALTGRPKEAKSKHGIIFHHGEKLAGKDEESNEMIKFISLTRGQIFIAMAYMGQGEYLDALRKAADKGRDVHIVTSTSDPSGKLRRLEMLFFLKGLARQPEKVHIYLTSQQFHAKVMATLEEDKPLSEAEVRRLWIGSKNMSMHAKSMNETQAEIKNPDPETFRFIYRTLFNENMSSEVDPPQLAVFTPKTLGQEFRLEAEKQFVEAFRLYTLFYKSRISRNRQKARAIIDGIMNNPKFWPDQSVAA